jgi:hypothetical protein
VGLRAGMDFFEVRTEYLYITCRAILVFEVVLCLIARCALVISTLNTVHAHTDRPTDRCDLRVEEVAAILRRRQ